MTNLVSDLVVPCDCEVSVCYVVLSGTVAKLDYGRGRSSSETPEKMAEGMSA